MTSTQSNSLGLGLDAGGTKTRWALARASGEIVADGQVGGMSALQMNTAAGRQYLIDTLSALAQSANNFVPQGQSLRVYAGITGFSEGGEDLRQLMAEALGMGLAPEHIDLGSDIDIAYHDLFTPGEGYVVYAGTGSIAAFIDQKGEMYRAGGRGAILDDAGGGFWIAREALRHIWRAEDERPGCWRDSPLAVEVFKRIGGSEWARSRQFVYGTPLTEARGEIGKLALAVAAAAERDPVAHGILTNAGSELGRLARALISRFGPRPIALAGRVVELHPAIEEGLRAGLPASTPLQIRNTEAHHAAARIAARNAVPQK